MFIQGDGKVGIGTTNPTDSLAVRGGIKIGEFNDSDGGGYAGSAAPDSANLGTGASDPQIRVSGRSTGNPGIIQMAQFDANNFFGGTTQFCLGRLQYAMNENSNEVTTVAEIRGITSEPNSAGHFDGALQFWTSQGDGSSASLTEKMVLTADGNLGIGTTSPARSLSVQTTSSSYGMARFTRDSTTHGEASIGFEHSSDATDAETWVVGTGGWSNTDDFVIGQGGAKFLIETSTGNVGIGDATPSHKLDVNGTGRFTGTLTGTGALTGAGSITSTEGDSNVELTQSTRGVFNGSASISSGSIVRIGNSAVHFGGSYVNDGGIFAVDAAETLFCVNYGADTLSSYDEYQSFEAHIYMGDDDNNRTRSVKVLGMWNGVAIDYTTWADLDESEEGFEISVASVTVDGVSHMGVIFTNRDDAIDQDKLNIRWSVNLLQAPTVIA